MNILYLSKLDILSFFIGLKPEMMLQLTQGDNSPNEVKAYTHNSYINLFYRYGCLIFILFFYFFYCELKKNRSNTFYLLITISIMMSQTLDDYLFGNRFEITILLWLIMALFAKKN